MKRLVINIIALCAVALGAQACGLTKPYPDKNTFALRVPAPEGSKKAPTTQAAVRVMLVRVSKPYDGLSFTYRTGASQFTTDYYNTFIAGPDRLLTGDLLEWVSASGVFSAALDPGTPADYRYVLTTQVTDLYGDYTDPKAPKAVIAVKAYFIEEQADWARTRFQKVYQQSEPMAQNTPAALVAAWERAWGHILGEMVGDLRASVASDTTAGR